MFWHSLQKNLLPASEFKSPDDITHHRTKKVGSTSENIMKTKKQRYEDFNILPQ